MAYAWKCEPCDQMVTQKFCPGCGAEYQAPAPQPAATGAATPEEPDFDYCSWKTNGSRCLLLASTWFQELNRDRMGQHSKPGYCHYHAMAKSTPWMVYGYEDDAGRHHSGFSYFESFVADMRARKLCTQFVHHEAQYVWGAMGGLIHDPKVDAVPCTSYTCWVPAVLASRDEKAKRAAEQRPENKAKNLLETVDRLAAQMTFPHSPDDEQAE